MHSDTLCADRYLICSKREACGGFPPCGCSRQVIANNKLKIVDVRLALEPYLLKLPSDGFCKKVKTQAMAILDAPADGAGPVGGKHRMGQLENYLGALENCGWHTKLFTKTGAQLKQVLIQKAKEEFEKQAKRRQKTEGSSSAHSTQWQEVDADYEEPATFEVGCVPGLGAMLEAVNEEGRYFYGFALIPPWAAHVLDKCAPKAIGVDAGHCSEEQKGVVLEIVASDANRQNVTLALAHFVDNESDRIVDPFFAFATANLGLNNAGITLHKDGGSSFAKARKAHMPDAKALLCEKHAKENVLEKVKVAGAAETYGRMVNATNSGGFNFVRSQAPTKLLSYIEGKRLPEAELFLAPFAAAGGKTQATVSTLKRGDEHHPVVKARTTSGFVESEMNANKSELWGSIRHSYPTDMALQAAEKMVGTMARHRVAAQKCKTSAPPKVMHMLGVLDKVATEQSHRIEPIGDQRDGKAKVYPNLRVSKNLYHVAELPGTCSCGFPGITDFPCVCLTMLAKKARGVSDFTTLLQESDRTTRWREQYDFDFAACLPATAVVFVQPPTNLLFPILALKPAGAPKRTRHKGWAENVTKSARKGIHTPGAAGSQTTGTPGAAGAAAATPQPRKVYKCRRCGQPKAGHTCSRI